ncbi:SAM-dependent methyltransferase [Rhodospirillum rubrum]|uniref:class I SAM-dependent DNA methyltransferase n=1 Tax=Rhodospirillum rubrum TaxID=1085 RepID=UPI001905285D|nr:class I SAM-dependent DNA methyltransferase [Rhodospirillum rubrum]MBK1666333.1 SAM-dependent methyltransferase [Rhodospirillum rubrum]MBK1678530.1 SAM-dependent methyltransferase [Rhodospirillum rubrum]
MTALLSWNEIKARANTFVGRWKYETRERAEAQAFWIEFFNIFGIDRKRFVSFEQRVDRLSNKSGTGIIDAFWPGKILIEHKSKDKDLDEATKQAMDYLDGLKERELPKVILVCDFERFRFRDLSRDGQEIAFNLKDLPKKVQLFGFLAGYERQELKEEEPANRKAAHLMGSIHETLEKAGYRGHQLEVLLVRLMFCLFAEDTGIFEKDLFFDFIDTRTKEDGSDLGPLLNHLFEVLDTEGKDRQASLDEILAKFPYVNGKLFNESLRIAAMNGEIREKILEASARFNWGDISPAVFGSMFQSIMNGDERRDAGAHYTSETNILKVINPLFMDALWAEFEGLKARRDTKKGVLLEAFHGRLAKLKFLDPACGCGNFLVIAYRELRILELEVVKEMQAFRGNTQLELDALDSLVKVNVHQFGGIEYGEWPARIAETALWLMDHQMNMKLLELGLVFTRLPLRSAPNIVVGNALRVDWSTVIPREEISFILGNPPFRGKQYQNGEQKADMKLVFGKAKRAGVLDYVSAWYLKAVQFIHQTAIEVGFVSTNSITQGEQVQPLWSCLSPYKPHINFAHRTFRWDSEGKGKAAVYCIIVGFSQKERVDKFVVEYHENTGDGHAIACKQINPYLVPGGAAVIVKARRNVLDTDAPTICYGSMANDGGNLIFESEAEKEAFLAAEPAAKRFIKPFVGSEEFISGEYRYCLWLTDATPSQIASMPKVLERVEAVKTKRLASTRPATNDLASKPHLFGEIRQPSKDYLFIPGVSSEFRNYIPMGFTPQDAICNDLGRSVEGAGLYEFGVLTSAMHMAWVRAVAGRLKGDFRYSAGLVYNTFPWPKDVKTTLRKAVEDAAKGVLDARKANPGETFDKLYHRTLMPAELVDAHRSLDRAVDRCYRQATFRTETERQKFLFDEYAKLIKAV